MQDLDKQLEITKNFEKGNKTSQDPKLGDSPWTWRDTLGRLQYIDTIIDRIVNSSIMLNINFFGAFGLLQIRGIGFNNGFTVRHASTIIALGGLIINLFLAKSLARQEHIRKWYFKKLPENIPLMPSKNSEEETVNKDSLIIKFGKMKPGYCETWIWILFLVAFIFFGLAWISWCTSRAAILSAISTIILCFTLVGLIHVKNVIIQPENK